jgi:hypothetical protein
MSSKEITLLGAMTKVGKKLKGSKLLKSKLKGTKMSLDVIQRQLHIDEIESLLFTTVFILQMQDESIDLRDFTRFLDITTLDALQYKASIDKLIQKKLVRCTSLSGAQFSTFISGRRNLKVRDTLLEAILDGCPIEEMPEKSMDVYDFNREVSEMIEDRSRNDLYTCDLFEQIRSLENENQQLAIIDELKNLNLRIAERTLLYEMADDFARAGFTALNSTLKDIYRNIRERMSKSNELIEERSPLMALGFISISEAPFHDDAKLELTAKCQELFFGDDVQLFQKRQAARNILPSKEIAQKTLFFEKSTNEQLSMITESLRQDHFLLLQERMKSHQMPIGVAAIFYGSPGTGKSESAYQLAKTTGRDIIAVDLSNTKSMWFGQSEKKIKEIFTEYNQACQRSPIKPILLFNEADGVLSRRSGNQHSSSTDQTENTMQNILLEQFEKNQGIIIATTNLEKNLDTAFERRFLFKVKFNRPSQDIRKQIWLDKCPWLTDETMDQLLKRFDFSGGEIDNILRKVLIQEVTTGSQHDAQLLLKYCEDERFDYQTSKKRMGYV